MKETLLSLILLLATFVVYAEDVTVKGKLVSASDKQPLPYATVSVASKTIPDQAIRKFATDESGIFSTTLKAGDYIFTFHFVGMNIINRNVEIKDGESLVNIGQIEMLESSTELAEIRVTAQRPLVKVEIDKLTYSAKDDPESSTSSVLDLLRKVPLVTVDGEDNKTVEHDLEQSVASAEKHAGEQHKGCRGNHRPGSTLRCRRCRRNHQYHHR